MHKTAFLRNHKRILRTLWQDTLCINSGLHNQWTRQPPKLTIPSPGSGTCHQKGGKLAWQRPRSLSDVGCFRTSDHTRQPALAYKYHWWGSASALHNVAATFVLNEYTVIFHKYVGYLIKRCCNVEKTLDSSFIYNPFQYLNKTFVLIFYIIWYNLPYIEWFLSIDVSNKMNWLLRQ